jgi:hypothetical protein
VTARPLARWWTEMASPVSAWLAVLLTGPGQIW